MHNEEWEDARSVSMHINKLQEELRKRQPIKDIIADKIKRTASYSYKIIQESTTAEIVEKFPFIVDKRVVR